MRTCTQVFNWPHTVEQVFDLVADVERYPDFVPGWSQTRIKRRDVDVVLVEQVMGLGPVGGRFNSQATISRPDRIHIVTTDGPFRRMSIKWSFTPQPTGCRVCFELEYELASKIVERLTGPVIEQAFNKIACAFEERAHHLYGEC